MESGVMYRNMWAQVGLVIITLGFYVFYWYYQTAKELQFLASDLYASPGLWTVLLFIPFGALYSYYKHGELFQVASTEKLNRWIIFILWIVFSPAVWFIVQTELNRRATYNRPG